MSSAETTGSSSSGKPRRFKPLKTLKRVSVKLGFGGRACDGASDGYDQPPSSPPSGRSTQGDNTELSATLPAPPSYSESATTSELPSQLSIAKTQPPPLRRLSLHSYITHPKNSPSSPGSSSSVSSVSSSNYLLSHYTCTVTLAPSSLSISANYSVTLYRDDSNLVMTTARHFKHFQALHSALEKELPSLGINSSFFPKAYTKSNFGISLTADQKNRRVALLNSWLSRVLLNSHSLLPPSQSLLHKFLLPPTNLEMLSARKIQELFKSQRMKKLAKCAVKLQCIVRGRIGREMAAEKYRNIQAMKIQARLRGKQGREFSNEYKERVNAAVMIQKIARKNRDVEKFFNFARQKRLATNFQDDYEFIGRHSEKGRMRKISQGQVSLKVVFEGALQIGRDLMVCTVCTDEECKTLYVTCFNTLSDECYRTELMDGDVQAVLGMMSGVATAVQEGGVERVIRSLHVKEEVRKVKIKKGKYNFVDVKVLAMRKDKKEMEASYELLLHGVRVVEKNKGIMGGGEKIMWIEEKEGLGSCVFVEEKRKRNRNRQPTRGIPLSEISEVVRIDAKPRRVRVVAKKQVVEVELCDKETAARVCSTLAKFREELEEKGGRKIKEEREGEGDRTFSNNNCEDDTVTVAGTMISDITMDTLESYDKKQLAFQREIMDGHVVQKKKRAIDVRINKVIEMREEEEAGGYGVGVFERMGLRGRKDS